MSQIHRLVKDAIGRIYLLDESDVPEFKKWNNEFFFDRNFDERTKDEYAEYEADLESLRLFAWDYE